MTDTYGSVGTQSRLRNIARRGSRIQDRGKFKLEEPYWGGVAWILNTTVTNGTTGTDEVGIRLTPGEDNEFELLYGNMINQSGATEQLDVAIQGPGRIGFFAWLLVASVGNGNHVSFPHHESTGGAITRIADAPRIFVSGEMELVARGAAIAVSQDIAFHIVCRVRGDAPTHTLFPADATEVVTEERFV